MRKAMGLIGALVLVACSSSSQNGDNGGGNPDGGGGGNPDGGSTQDGGGNPDGGGGGGGVAHWAAAPLPAPHDTDNVTGILFSSPTAGFIATVHGGGSSGAVFASNGTTVGTIAFDGNVSPSAGGVLGGLDFDGLRPTAAGGIVALTSANDLVSAPSATGAFTDVKMASSNIGGGQVAGAYFGTSVSILGIDLNGFEKAASVPGPTSSWSDIFDPGSNPTVPNPIPPDQCQDGIQVSDAFESGLSSVTFSADGNTIAYSTLSDADGVPEVCVSKDGGQTFKPTLLTGKPQLKPGGVIFPKASDPSTLIVYSGDQVNADANFVLRSTDTGATFNPVTLPAGLTAKELKLYGAYFLADGMHGWIVGYDANADTGLALVTTDGGATWTVDAGVAAATGAGTQRLHSVFALDASHVWMGGENGTFIAGTP